MTVVDGTGNDQWSEKFLHPWEEGPGKAQKYVAAPIYLPDALNRFARIR